MSILNAIGEDEDIFSFKFFALEDLGTSYDVGLLVDNIEKVKEYYTACSFKIKTLDDFIDYLFLRKYNQFDAVLPIIKENKKAEAEAAIAIVKDSFNKYKKGEAYKFARTCGCLVSDEDCNQINILEQLLEIIASSNGGLNDLLEIFIIHRPLFIINDFQKFQPMVERSTQLFAALFSATTFEKIKDYGFGDFLDILRQYHKNKKHIEELKPLVKSIKDYGLSAFDLMNEDNYLNYEYIFIGIRNFLCDIESEFANDFLEKTFELDIVKHKYLEKHGKTFSCNIPINDMLEPLKDEKMPWQYRILLLTHGPNKKTKQIQHYYQTVIQNSKIHITDVACDSSLPYNDYFTFSTQNTLNIYNQCYLSLLKYFISNERVGTLFNWMFLLMQEVCNAFNIDYSEAEYKIDLEILLNMYVAILNQDKIDDADSMNKGLFYGVTMFTFALLEKFLRNLYKSLNKDKYIKDDWASLGNLIDIKNETIVSLLGEEVVRCLRFYILRDNDGNVGYNYRNNFAHYKNISSDAFTYGSCIHSLQFLIGTLNQLSL